MGKPTSSNVKRAETMPLSTKVNKEVLNGFKDYCSYLGYPMNVMLETFMRQYIDNKFPIKSTEITQWEDDGSELDALSTTLNKEIYLEFKFICKENGYYLKHVLTAFMEKIVKEDYVLEYKKVKNDKV